MENQEENQQTNEENLKNNNINNNNNNNSDLPDLMDNPKLMDSMLKSLNSII